MNIRVVRFWVCSIALLASFAIHSDNAALVSLVRGGGGPPSAVAWSPDGKRIVTGAQYRDGIVRVWPLKHPGMEPVALATPREPVGEVLRKAVGLINSFMAIRVRGCKPILPAVSYQMDSPYRSKLRDPRLPGP